MRPERGTPVMAVTFDCVKHGVQPALWDTHGIICAGCYRPRLVTPVSRRDQDAELKVRKRPEMRQ